MPFVFSPAFPFTLPRGLLIAAKSSETALTTTADTPTAATVLAGLGTQICCTRLVDEEGTAVGVTVGLGDLEEVGLDDVDEDEVGEVEVAGVCEADVPAASEITETVPEPSFATKTSFLPES